MTLRHTLLRAASVTLAAMLVPGCQPRPQAAAPGTPTAQAPAADRSAPSLEELRNATYSGVAEAGASFTLAGGRWEGPPFEPGAASRPGVTFVRDFRLLGDLDGDGAEEAVVLLGAHAGGSGERSYVAVVGRTASTPRNLATAPLGDRVHVRDARINGRAIVLDVVQAGEHDAACCPGDLVTRTWTLDAGALKEGAPVKTGRLSIDVLAGTEWVLKAWAWDQAAPAAPEVTLKLDGSRVGGSAGCNNYFAPVKPGDAPGDITMGPAGATRKMCPEPDMLVEARFLRQLVGVTQLRFVAAQLALSYTREDGTLGVMLFGRRAAQSQRRD